MNAAAKLAIVPDRDEDALSPAEILANCSGAELLIASQEKSKVYNGKVLAQAFLIVQCRLRCRSPYDMVELLGIGRNTVCRYSKGYPLSDSLLNRALRELAFLLAES